MKRNAPSLLVIGILMLVSFATVSPTAAATLLDRIVAVVNEDIILLSEVRERMEIYVQRIRQQGFDTDTEKKMVFKVREDTINRLVDEKLTDQEIKRYGIKVDEATIDNTIEQIKAANYFTDEDLRHYLEKEQVTLEQYRSKIREQALRTRLVNYQVKSKIVITEAEIRDYYDRHPEIYGGKIRYHLRNIFMRVPEYSTDAEKAAVLERMEQLRSRIADGDAFADLARIYSQGPAAADGGDIGEFDKKDLSPLIQAALEGLEPGQVTGVLDTDPGLQLFYVEAIHRTEGSPLEAVEEEIHQKLFTEVVDQKFLSWLEDLRSQSYIKIIN